ncbi:MAG: hypothetical protein CMJ54_10180 [Planctomycetaceae bacterium]|nr:hypothetical protein [Planctomycetaceae bacterium]
MTPSVPTAATPRRLPPVGSFAWAVNVCGQAMLDWRSGLRPLAVFIASAAGLILALASVELPGGTMPALPVLLVTVVHHSVALLLRRIMVVIVVIATSHGLLGVLSDQPWVLVIIAFAIAFIGFYLLARGLDLLSYLLAILVPVLFAWQSANGVVDAHSAWIEFQQLIIGLLVSGTLGILFLGDRLERGLRDRLSSDLESVGTSLLKPLDEEYGDGFLTWDARRSASLETLLQGIHRVRGRSIAATNLILAGDCVRYLLGINRMRLALLEHGRPTFFLEGVAGSLPDARDRLGRQLLEVSAAIRENRPAASIPGLAASARRFRSDCRRLVVNAPEGTPVMQISFIAAASRALTDMHRIARTLVATTGRTRAIPASRLRMPRWNQRSDWNVGTVLGELCTHPDEAGLAFAIKGTIATGIAFTIASVYDQWAGAAVFLLMTMFLSTVFQGSLRASMMLRAVGLLLSTMVSLFTITTVFPNLGSAGGYAIFIAIVLLPGGMMIVQPRSAAAGLNYAMSLFYVFTTNARLEVGLDLVDDRFIAVAGASLLPWLVFGLVRPTYARDRIEACFATAIGSVRRSIELPLLPATGNDAAEMESLADGLAALTMIRTMTDNAAIELVDDPERQRMNRRLVDRVDQIFVLSRFYVRTAFLGEGVRVSRVEADVLTSLSDMLTATHRRLTGQRPRPEDASATDRALASLTALDASIEDRIAGHRTGAGLRLTLIHLVMLHDLVAGLRDFDRLLEARTRLLETRSLISLGDG